MRSRGIVLILFAFIAISESEISRARVTFPFSEVIPIADERPTQFNCAGCLVYTTKDMTVNQNDKTATKINITAIESGTASKGHILQSGSYTISSTRSYYSSNEQFIAYVVNATAPNFGSPVFALQDNHEMVVKTNKRYFTILSNSNAMELRNFSGNFPPGYPKVYAAGYDAVSYLYGVTSCRPVYEARSQRNAEQSSPVVYAPIVTVDFGYEGAHSVSVNDLRYRNGDLMKSAGASTVFMSPGHIGCPFMGSQIYDASDSETTVRDSFTIIASSLNISLSCYFDLFPRRSNKFRVNRDNLDFNPAGPPSFSKLYGPGAFKVELEWTGYAESSWAMQLDFGSPISQTFFEQRSNGSATTPSIQLFSEQPPKVSEPRPPSPTGQARAETTPWPIRWKWETYAPASAKSMDTSWWPYYDTTAVPQLYNSDSLLSMTFHIRLLHICLFLFVVATLLFCLYRRRKAARAFDGLPLTANK